MLGVSGYVCALLDGGDDGCVGVEGAVLGVTRHALILLSSPTESATMVGSPASSEAQVYVSL